MMHLKFKLSAVVGQEDCKLRVSYVQVIFAIKRQNKAFLKHVQQTAWERIFYYQS